MKEHSETGGCILTLHFYIGIAEETKLKTNSSLWISGAAWQQVSEIHPSSHCALFQPIAADVVIAMHRHTLTHLSLCLSLVPSPLKRHTGGCAPLDMCARILTLETEDGHGCAL